MTRTIQKYVWLTAIFCIPSSTSFAQNFITNYSFEGPDGIEVTPEDWFPGCGVKNTPDTQPGWWNVENKPQHGKSFINLLYKDDGTTESVYQKLAKPLPAGSCFLVEIHLAQACQDSLSGLFAYDLNHPGDLVIRASETYGCNNGQVIAVFEQVSNCRWKKYQAVFQAQTDLHYIYLEFFKGSSSHNNGSILIDNFSIDFLNPLPQQSLSFAYQEEVLLQATVEGTNFNWQIGDTYLENDSSFQYLTVNQNIAVHLEYWSLDSCLVIEDFIIFVRPLIPNIITPLDQNGINDVFYISGLIETASLQIINRWGKTIYSTSNYQNDWEPKQVVSGVYFYSLYLEESARSFQGFVTIQ